MTQVRNVNVSILTVLNYCHIKTSENNAWTAFVGQTLVLKLEEVQKQKYLISFD